MPQYTYAQIQQIWVNAGGNAQAAPVAAAVAWAESGGNSDAIGHNTNGSQDRGLWQINSVHGAQSTTDVAGNVRAAIAISANGSDWKPWCTTWTDGCKGTYAPTAANTPSGKAFASQGGGSGEPLVPTGAPASATNASSDPLSADFWTHLIDVMGNWTFYSGLIVAGAIMSAVGVALMAKDTPVGQAAGRAVGTVGKLLPLLAL